MLLGRERDANYLPEKGGTTERKGVQKREAGGSGRLYIKKRDVREETQLFRGERKS